MSLILEWFPTILLACRDDCRGTMFTNQSQYCNIKEIYSVTKASGNLYHGVQVLNIIEQSRTLAMRWNRLNLQMSLNLERNQYISLVWKPLLSRSFQIGMMWHHAGHKQDVIDLVSHESSNPLRIMLDLPTQIVASATVSQVDRTATTGCWRLLFKSIIPWVPNCVKALGVINCRHQGLFLYSKSAGADGRKRPGPTNRA